MTKGMLRLSGGFYNSKMAIGGFQDLQVWQKSFQFATEVYRAVEAFPDSEKFGLRSQLTWAAVSISSNIAEGHGRKSSADFVRFLRISMGSCRECQSLLLICHELGYLKDPNKQLFESAEEIAKMIAGLIKHLQSTTKLGNSAT